MAAEVPETEVERKFSADKERHFSIVNGDITGKKEDCWAGRMEWANILMTSDIRRQ